MFTWTATISGNNPVEITWENHYFGMNDKQLIMEIDGQPSLIDMRLTTSATVQPGHTFRIHYGDLSYIAKETISESPLIGEISPNPSTRSGVVRFAVSMPSGGGKVSVVFIDTTGKTYMLGEKSAAPGRGWVESNDLPSTLAQGLYVARIVVETGGNRTAFYRKVIID